VCALLLSLAYPLRQYVEQQQRIGALEDEMRERTTAVAQLTEQQERWRDPAYVKAQARQRLRFVMPGETAYVVIGPGTPQSVEVVGGPADQNGTTWYGRLWSSVEQADR
jgi:cell division protein FtsB